MADCVAVTGLGILAPVGVDEVVNVVGEAPLGPNVVLGAVMGSMSTVVETETVTGGGKLMRYAYNSSPK